MKTQETWVKSLKKIRQHLEPKFKQELQVLWGELKNFPREKDPEILKPYFKKMGQRLLDLAQDTEHEVIKAFKTSSTTKKAKSKKAPAKKATKKVSKKVSAKTAKK